MRRTVYTCICDGARLSRPASRTISVRLGDEAIEAAAPGGVGVCVCVISLVYQSKGKKSEAYCLVIDMGFFQLTAGRAIAIMSVKRVFCFKRHLPPNSKYGNSKQSPNENL